jgi:GxxExxY protein
MIYEKDLSDKVIGCAITVHKILGSGFLEKVYEKSLEIELKLNDVNCVSQFPVKVSYKDNIVGDYYIDLLVENKIVLELKSCSSLQAIHEAQLYNYLVATGYKIGYVINFGSHGKLEFKRIVL